MSAPAFLRRLERETCVRLKPSPIHGVGVFAVQSIKQHTDCFPRIRTDVETRFVAESELQAVQPETRRMIQDFCLQRNEGGTTGRWVMTDGFAAMDMSFYLNAATGKNDANVEMFNDPRSSMCCFRAKRDIAAGEELLFDYGRPASAV